MKQLQHFRLLYLATPYSKYPKGIEQAFIDASTLAATLLRAGAKVYSPIAHTHPLAIHGKIDPFDHDIWLPFDQAMMDASEAIVVAMMESWELSRGIQHEIDYFTAVKKPVFDLDPKTMLVRSRP